MTQLKKIFRHTPVRWKLWTAMMHTIKQEIKIIPLVRTELSMRMKKIQFLKKLYLRVINNRQSRPAQILLTDCVSCLNLPPYRP